MTLLWALLALQLGFTFSCFITNCPQGGKRSSPALSADALQLSSGTLPLLPLDAPLLQPDQQHRLPAGQMEKRFLMALQPRYRTAAGRAAQSRLGACSLPGICSYPDCCGFEECADSTECKVLRRGYRILVKYIFSKLESAGPLMLDESTPPELR